MKNKLYFENHTSFFVLPVYVFFWNVLIFFAMYQPVHFCISTLPMSRIYLNICKINPPISKSSSHETHEEKISQFSYTTNVNRKTVSTRTFGNNGPSSFLAPIARVISWWRDKVVVIAHLRTIFSSKLVLKYEMTRAIGAKNDESRSRSRGNGILIESKLKCTRYSCGDLSLVFVFTKHIFICIYMYILLFLSHGKLFLKT